MPCANYSDSHSARRIPEASAQAKFSQIEPIRLLIAEDHPVFQEGLGLVLSSQSDMLVIAKTATSPEAIAEFRRHRPDVALISQDLCRATGTGTDALIAIRAQFPSARIIILASADRDVEIQRALRAGAVSYVLKSTTKNELQEIVRSVHRGRKRIPPNVATALAEHLGMEDLTAREIDVLTLIRDGTRNKHIAARLSIAETTVNFHIKNLVSKLQANDRTHAVTIAIQRGVLPLWSC